MSWEGGYWGIGGAIDRAERTFAKTQKLPSDMVALASAHYSALGTAMVRLKQGEFWYTWRAVKSAWRALQLANIAFDVGCLRLTADNVDVLCCIWWRLNRRNHRALEALRLPVLAEIQHHHTVAFILLHQVRFWKIGLGDSLVTMVCGYAEAAANSGDVAQAGRVYRQLYELLPRHDFTRERYWQRALDCARQAGATDQIEKLGVRVG